MDAINTPGTLRAQPFHHIDGCDYYTNTYLWINAMEHPPRALYANITIVRDEMFAIGTPPAFPGWLAITRAWVETQGVRRWLELHPSRDSGIEQGRARLVQMARFAPCDLPANTPASVYIELQDVRNGMLYLFCNEHTEVNDVY